MHEEKKREALEWRSQGREEEEEEEEEWAQRLPRASGDHLAICRRVGGARGPWSRRARLNSCAHTSEHHTMRIVLAKLGAVYTIWIFNAPYTRRTMHYSMSKLRHNGRSL